MTVSSSEDKWSPGLPAPIVHDSFTSVRWSKGSLGLLIKFCADLTMASVASVVGLIWARASGFSMPPVWMMACYAPMVLLVCAARSTYQRKLHDTLVGEFMSVQMTAALAAIVLLAGMVLSDVPGNLGDTIARVWLTTAALLPVGRVSAVLIKRSLRRRQFLQSPTLIMGNGEIACHLATRFLDNPQYGIRPVGLIDADTPWTSTGDDCPIPAVGRPETIAEAISSTDAEAVVVAFSKTRDEDLISAIRTARLAGLTVWVVPRMFDTIGKSSRVDYVGGLPVLTLSNTNPRGWQFAVKHVADRILATTILIVISPLFLLLMAAVKASSPGPVFFRQSRIGRDAIVFDCLKFRSMRPPRPSDAAFIPCDGRAPGGVEGVDRRTAIGKLMRCSSLDELPQLLNVIKGQMSLVGPRPERPEFVHMFNTQIRRYGERHRVKAGMTGWAQVHGLRGQTSIADRAEWDNFYIENWSLMLDLQILLMTVPAVMRPGESIFRAFRAPTATVNPPELAMPAVITDSHLNHVTDSADLHVVAAANAVAVSVLTKQVLDWLELRLYLTEERRSDIMLATYEALSNCAEHAYRDQPRPADMTLDVAYDAPSSTVLVRVSDRGKWIDPPDLPASASRGRGIKLMQALSDHVSIDGRPQGTTVRLHFERCTPASPQHRDHCSQHPDRQQSAGLITRTLQNDA
jgi:exopolysaccharide biosynthesis polyprenyl glycosylphosphotransferase